MDLGQFLFGILLQFFGWGLTNTTNPVMIPVGLTMAVAGALLMFFSLDSG